MAKQRAVGMDRHTIRAEVHRKGATLRAIALQAGLDESACRSALIRRHVAGEQALANFLGMRPEEVWPKRYATTRSPWPKGTAKETARTSQNGDGLADMGAAA